MPSTKSVAKKQKVSTAKKPATRSKPSAKPLKLGGVPNQGSLG